MYILTTAFFDVLDSHVHIWSLIGSSAQVVNGNTIAFIAARLVSQ